MPSIFTRLPRQYLPARFALPTQVSVLLCALSASPARRRIRPQCLEMLSLFAILCGINSGSRGLAAPPALSPVNLPSGSTLCATVATDGKIAFPTFAGPGFTIRIAAKQIGTAKSGLPHNLIGLYPVANQGADSTPYWGLKVNSLGFVYGTVADKLTAYGSVGSQTTKSHTASVNTSFPVSNQWHVWTMTFSVTTQTLTVYRTNDSGTTDSMGQATMGPSGETLHSPDGLMEFRVGDINAPQDYQVAEIGVWPTVLDSSTISRLGGSVPTDADLGNATWYSRPIINADPAYVYQDAGSTEVDLKAILKSGGTYSSPGNLPTWAQATPAEYTSTFTNQSTSAYTKTLAPPSVTGAYANQIRRMLVFTESSYTQSYYSSGQRYPSATEDPTCTVSGLLPGNAFYFRTIFLCGQQVKYCDLAGSVQSARANSILDTIAADNSTGIDATSGFGVSWNQAREVDLTSSTLGLPSVARIARIGLSWGGTEPTRNNFNWSWLYRGIGVGDFANYNDMITSLIGAGCKPMVLLSYGNPLYNPTTTTLSLSELVPWEQTELDAMARWTKIAVAQVPNDTPTYYRNNVIWEVWNEPGCAPKMYTVFYDTIAAAIRSVSPNATIVGPSLGGIPWADILAYSQPVTWNGKLYPGILTQIDGFSVHPYRAKAPETVENDYRQLRYLLNKFSPDHRVYPVSGEWGFPVDQSGDWPKNEDAKAQDVARQRLTNLGLGLPLDVYFDWWQDDGAGKFGLLDGKGPNNNNSGYANSSEVPGPRTADGGGSTNLRAFDAAKTLVDELNGYRFDHFLLPGTFNLRADTGDGRHDYGMLLRNSSDQLKLALWTTEDSSNTSVAFPTWSLETTGKTYVGGNANSLETSQSPIYFDLTSTPAQTTWNWYKTDPTKPLRPHDFIAAGASETYNLKITNFAIQSRSYRVSFPSTGNVTVTPSVVDIAVGGNDYATASVTVQVSRETQPTDSEPPSTNFPQVPRVSAQMTLSVLSGQTYALVDSADIPLVVTNPLKVTVSDIVTPSFDSSATSVSGTAYVQVDTGAEKPANNTQVVAVVSVVNDSGAVVSTATTTTVYNGNESFKSVPVNLTGVAVTNGHYNLKATVTLTGASVTTATTSYRLVDTLNFFADGTTTRVSGGTGGAGTNTGIWAYSFLSHTGNDPFGLPRFFHLDWPRSQRTEYTVGTGTGGGLLDLAGRPALHVKAGFTWSGFTVVTPFKNKTVSPYYDLFELSASSPAPTKIGMWVYGSGKGENVSLIWQRKAIRTGPGSQTLVFDQKGQPAIGIPVTWTGWRWVTVDTALPALPPNSGAYTYAWETTDASADGNRWQNAFAAAGSGPGSPIVDSTTADSVDLKVADITPLN